MTIKVSRKDREELRNILNKFSKKRTKREIFYNLCFALTAPQTAFKNNMKVIQELKRSEFYEKPVDLFLGTFQKEKNSLKKLLKPVRFYNNKARYLIGAKKNFDKVLDLIWKEHGNYCYLNKDCGYDKREWLVKNVKGLGMKAASHFLRNLGYDALAIIDTHILKFMAEELGYYEYPKSIGIRYYKELEMDFQYIAGKLNLTTAELDALIWKEYSGTSWEDFKY